MTSMPNIIRLSPCPKGYDKDIDKTIPPSQTVDIIKKRFSEAKLDILQETVRVDLGRLGIPVYMSRCGSDALAVMPTRKQMGKGASPEQAQASAVMELVERFSFFSFFDEFPGQLLHWKQAEELFSENLLDIGEITKSVNEDLSPQRAREVMDLVPWHFFPATRLRDERQTWLPLDWFKQLNEFNGASAGNSQEESILQGLSEIVERHVCCLVDRQHLATPTIVNESCTDPVLANLLRKFEKENIHITLKDFSLGMPMPTVGAIAWDPATFPHESEIVFTAGTASSPTKAAIRAVTEIAQLAGDFCTRACYEASGLGKFARIEDAAWLLEGPQIRLEQLPSVQADDIMDELKTAINALPYNVYCVATTNPALSIPAHYTMMPGASFRERDRNQSLGLYVGRRLVETKSREEAHKGLDMLSVHYPDAHFVPFFRGLTEINAEQWESAYGFMQKALPLQPDDDSQALVSFYTGFIDTRCNRWTQALPHLQAAVRLCPDMKEYGNLLGVSHFKLGQFEQAAECFRQVLSVDKGSAMDMANLGICEKNLGHHAQAMEHLSSALALDPSLEFVRPHLEQLTEAMAKSR